MNQKILKRVFLRLPQSEFTKQLLTYLSGVGQKDGDNLSLRQSSPEYLPNIEITLSNTVRPSFTFTTDAKSTDIDLANETGETKISPEVYSKISISDFLQRAQSFHVNYLDHLGFNLPWFSGVHPSILELRKEYYKSCAYYRFPTGEEWDFILPARSNK